MSLETDRLRLAEWEPEDWLALRPIATDPEVMRHITGGRPWPDEEVREFVRRQIEGFARRRYCLWKLLDKAGNRLIGFCGLQALNLDGNSEVEIGWWLARDCWGKGLATEAARAALRYGFEQARLQRIVAIARSANLASLRVMRKLGMSYERDVVHKGVPVVVFSIQSTAKDSS